MNIDYLDLSLIRIYTEIALRDANPAMRALYRQKAIQEAGKIGLTLTLEDFQPFPGKTPENTDENATNNAPETTGNEKPDVPNALPEYPGQCPVCGVSVKSNLAWLGHKKVHH